MGVKIPASYVSLEGGFNSSPQVCSEFIQACLVKINEAHSVVPRKETKEMSGLRQVLFISVR